MKIKRGSAFNIIGRFVFFTYLISSVLTPLAYAQQTTEKISTQSSEISGTVIDSNAVSDKTITADATPVPLTAKERAVLEKANPDLVRLKALDADGKEMAIPIEKKVADKKAAQQSMAMLALPNDGVSVTTQSPIPLKPEIDQSSGALVYNYDFTVPQGVKGFTPKVGIKYNSQKLKDGSSFGYGWSLNVPYIERLNKNGVNQMYSRNDFSHSDLGELKNISGSNYGLRVDTGDFYNFVFSNNSWTVKDKQGNIYSYGSTTAARQDNVASSTQVFRWMLEKVQDVNGNVINYSYYKDNGQIYLASIKYAYLSTTPYYKIDFATTTTASRKSYNGGFLTDNKFLINNAKVYTNGSVSREYSIAYSSPATNTPFATINSITETAYSSSGNSTKTATFQYIDNTSTMEFATSTTFQIPIELTRFSSGGLTNNWVFIDYNNDALPDIIKCNNLGGGSLPACSAYQYWKNTGTTWTTDATPTNPLPGPMLYAGDPSKAYFTDINGDYKADVVVPPNPYPNSPTSVYMHVGSGWVLDASSTIPLTIGMVGNYFTTMLYSYGMFVSSGFRNFDLNADGLLDLMLLAFDTGSNAWPGIGRQVWLNTGTATTTSVFTQSTTTYQSSQVGQRLYFTSLSSDPGTGTYLDSNNDGLGDLALTPIGASPVKLTPNGGSDFVASTTTNYINYDSCCNQMHFDIDLNGDGYADTLYQDNSSGSTGYTATNTTASWATKKVYINQHDDSIKETSIGPKFSGFGLGYYPTSIYSPCCSNYQKKPFYLIDVNGDGLNDIVEIESRDFESPATTTRLVWMNPTKIPGQMKTVSYSSGATYGFTYKGSAQYKDGSGNSLSPDLPFVIQTVNTMSESDGIGNTATTTYEYAGGSYYYNGYLDRKFAGFARVTTTKPDSSKIISYYSQGDTTDSGNYEYNDNVSKIGKVYRTDTINSASSTIKRVTTKWDSYATTSDRYFVYPLQTVTEHDGTAEAISYTYSTFTGNLSDKAEWGTVTASTPLAFSDTGNDKRTTFYTYNKNTTTNVTVPTNITLKDQSGTKVAEQIITYDGGTLSKGLPTNIASWLVSSTYNNSQKSYYSSGQVNTETDPRGKVTTYTYDSYNLLPTTIARPLSLSKTITYDYAVQKPVQITDENNRKFSFTYDGYGRIKTESIPIDSAPTSTTTKNTYTYNDVGTSSTKVYVQKTSSDPTTNYYTLYDGLGRDIRSITQASSSGYLAIDKTYDSLGRVSNSSLPYYYGGTLTTYSGSSSPSNLRNTYSYDGLDRVTSISNSIGTTNTSYSGNTTTVTDANSKVKAYTKDGLGRLVQVTENLSGTPYNTYYEWNPSDKLTKVTDASSNVRNFTYDGEGKRLTAEDLHAGGDGTFGTFSYAYDASGNLTQKTTPNSDVIVYTYDDINRPLTEKLSGDANSRITYSYDSCTDGKTKLCGVTNVNGVNYGYTYTANGNVKTEGIVVPGLVGTSTTSYAYDTQQNLKNITNPDTTQVLYSYSYRNLPTAIQYQNGATQNILSNVTYNELSQPSVISYQNGVSTTNSYDSTKMLRLTNRLSQGAGPKFQDVTYTYDNVGNILTLTDNSNTDTQKTVTYGYDDLYRLTSASTTAVASGTTPYSNSYTYNILGNILTNGANTYTYSGTSYQNPHALSSMGSTTYSYDNNGNLLSDGTTTNAWTYRSELGTSTIALSTTTTATSTYLYDQNSIRVKVLTASSTKYNLNKYYRTDTSTTTKNIYLGDILVATIDTASTTDIVNSYLTDNLGSTEKVIDSAGALKSLSDYYPYGQLRIQTGNQTERGYVGEIADQNNLNYLNARYLNNLSGQFISEDPVFWEIGLTKDGQSALTNPQAQNSYSYAGNNPILLKDSTGRYLEVAFTRSSVSQMQSATVGLRLDGNGLDFFTSLGAGPSTGGAVSLSWAPGKNLTHQANVTTAVSTFATEEFGVFASQPITSGSNGKYEFAKELPTVGVAVGVGGGKTLNQEFSYPVPYMVWKEPQKSLQPIDYKKDQSSLVPASSVNSVSQPPISMQPHRSPTDFINTIKSVYNTITNNKK